MIDKIITSHTKKDWENVLIRLERLRINWFNGDKATAGKDFYKENKEGYSIRLVDNSYIICAPYIHYKEMKGVYQFLSAKEYLSK